MQDVAAQIVEILKKHMREAPATISPDTKLSELEIESLDLAMIVFDIEDTFSIEIPYNANEAVDNFATVGTIADKVESLIIASREAA